MQKRIIRFLKTVFKARRSFFRFIFLKAVSLLPERLTFTRNAKIVLAGPKVLCIGISSRCNFSCLFCPEHSPLELDLDSPYYKERKLRQREYLDHQMDFALFKSIVDEASCLNVRLIEFAGPGDSILHPQFIDMLKYARREKMHCGVCSNGELITPEIAEKLVDLEVDYLHVSLNAASVDTHRFLHNINRDAFSSVIKNLKFLSFYKEKNNKSKPVLSLSYVICKKNFKEVKSMVKRAIEVNAKTILFLNFLRCKAREGLVNFMSLEKKDVPTLENFMLEASLLAKKNGLNTNIPSFLYKLQAPKVDTFSVKEKCIEICQIQADGAVAFYDYCYLMGNVNKNSFIEIWYSSKNIKFRKEVLHLSQSNGSMPNYPFCRRCNAPLYDKSLCTIQC